jgi:IS30 family transposase
MAKSHNKTKHLSYEERFAIQKMLHTGATYTHISLVLERGVSTISEEVKKNGGKERYDANKAHNRAYWRQYRKKRDCNQVAMHGALARYVEKKLRDGWSPEVISQRLAREKRFPYASPKSIRKYIAKRHGLERFLFWNRVHKKSGPKRKGNIFLSDEGRKSIVLRPETTGFGHFEGDFIVSKASPSVLLVLIEKSTKYVHLRLLPNRENDAVNDVISSCVGTLAKSLTLDNDIAFRKWRQLETLIDTDVFFCHPFASWEKGLVENTNRWIRQFIPKKSNLADWTPEQIQTIEDWLNHTPKVSLRGMTPYEKMMEIKNDTCVSSLDVPLPTF